MLLTYSKGSIQLYQQAHLNYPSISLIHRSRSKKVMFNIVGSAILAVHFYKEFGQMILTIKN